MDTKNTNTRYVIDATGKRLGNIATEAASVLLGKNTTTYTRHLVAPVIVAIENAAKMDVPEGKKTEIYQNYSGYPGGLREETLGHLAKRRGNGEVIRRTISGMLPSNKLKKIIIKNLVISE